MLVNANTCDWNTRLARLSWLSLIFPFLTLFALVWLTATAGVFAADENASEKPAVTILAFGDSLTAGYGLGPGDGFTDQLENWLSERMDAPVAVVNAGVSGDTTTGGRSRLAWTLGDYQNDQPDLVLLTLGGNDGLRGLDPAITRANMDAMLKTLTERGTPTLVGGMMAPPNLGPDYAKAFNQIYPDLSAAYGAALYPFFLDGVAAMEALNQADGIHPNREGVALIVSRIGPVILSLLNPDEGN